MPLSDLAVKAAKPKEKVYRVFDADGLYLEVHPNGSKYWRMKCHFNNREDRLAFGVYPKVSLAEARLKCRKAQDALAAGRNPRHQQDQGSDQKFKTIAKAWFDARKGVWSERYADTVWHRLEADVFPRLDKEIDRIDAQDVLAVIRPIDARGAPVKAKRILRYINSIFDFAIVTIGEMRYNPAVGLHIAISSRPVKHNPYLKENELPEFLRRLDNYQGACVTLLATKFLLLTMTRTSETRFARIDEIDWKEKIWKIPAERMKMARDHWVPLSKQALDVLEEAKSLGGGDYLFSSPIRRGRPISENTILYAIYDLGYRDKLTGHGFRATASTILNERGHHSLAIERQLAHVDRNTVRASYNHAEFLSERRVILQAWADLLDDLRNCG